MKTFKLKALTFTAVLEMAVILLPYILPIEYGYYLINSVVSTVLSMLLFLGYFVLSREYSKGFSLSRNVQIINIVWPFLVTFIISNMYSFVDYETMGIYVFLSINIVAYIVDILMSIGLGKGVVSILKTTGEIKLANKVNKALLANVLFLTFSIISSFFTQYTVNFMYPAMGMKMILLALSVYVGVAFDGKAISNYNSGYSEFSNNSVTNIANKTNTIKQQTGYSTRDEIYKQFEGK